MPINDHKNMEMLIFFSYLHLVSELWAYFQIFETTFEILGCVGCQITNPECLPIYFETINNCEQ